MAGQIRWLIGIAAIGAGVVLPLSASGAGADPPAQRGGPASEVVFNDLVVEYTLAGLPGGDSKAKMSHRKGELIFSDRNGIRGDAKACRRLSAKKVACKDGGRFPIMVQVYLDDGDDTLANRLRPSTLLGIYLGGGDDVFKGGRKADAADGEEGNDVLRGGKGRDALEGGEGRDVLLGGPDRDSLYADDGTRDKRIDCGPGGGKAEIDDKDPEPRRC